MFDHAWKQLGWETVAFAEMDKFCQRVLEKHYPGVPIYDNVCEVTYERLQKDGITDVSLVCGGFPCTDISVAGKQAGIDGERSGLWGEFARIISEFKPRWVVVENVSALLSGDDGRWMGRVLGDLAQIGYDAEWHVIPAGNADGRLSAGAPHRRERVWIVAYPNQQQFSDDRRGCARKGDKSPTGTRADESSNSGTPPIDVAYPGLSEPQGRNQPTADHDRCSGEGIQEGREPAPPCDAADPTGTRLEGFRGQPSELAHEKGWERPYKGQTGLPGEDVGNTGRSRQSGQGQSVNASDQAKEREGQADQPVNVSERGVGPAQSSLGILANGIAAGLSRSRWLPEPGIGRVATGVPDRVNKLKALGNGLVWQIPFAIGQAIEMRERHV